MRIRRKYLIVLLLCVLAVAGPTLLAGCGTGHGAWLYDAEENAWYQEVETSPSPIGLPQASRAINKYRETLHSIPGVNSSGVGRLSSGDHYIEIMFASVKERDRAMREDLIPAVLDGVPVIVDNFTGIARPAGL